MTPPLDLQPVLLAVLAALALTTADAQPAGDSPFVLPTREAFLRSLELAQPELAAVKAALDAGDVPAAGRAYAARFRAKPISSPLLTNWDALRRNPQAIHPVADAILAGHIHDGYSQYEVPATGFDWHGSPLSCCTRFPILSGLRWAIQDTRDPKYIRWTADHILGYIGAYPIADFAGKSSHTGWTSHTVTAQPWYWCMIPERLTELSETVTLLSRCPEVADDELLTILQRMHEENGYLATEIKSWVDARHNGGCSMIESMAQVASVLEDFEASKRCLAFAAELEAQYIDQAFYRDGMCVELTCAYSMECAMIAQRMAYALRQQPAMQAHREKLAALVQCLVGLSDPKGWLPSFGDLYAGPVYQCLHAPLIEWLALPWAGAIAARKSDPPPPFLEWPRAAGQGQVGDEQWCGYYTMRSGWDADGRYMAIDGGPWGTTHQHGDRLSLVVTANGAKFIIDPSSTRYAANEPDAFIGGQPSGFLHNTITVDGVDEFFSEGTVTEAKAPLKNTWEAGPAHVLFAADYTFAPVKPVRWERRVLFPGREYWLLQDVLTAPPGDPVSVEQNFQFEADIEIAFDGDRTIATAPNGARLLLVPLEGGLAPQLTVGDKAPHVSYWPGGKPSNILRSEDGYDQRHGRGWTGRSGHKLLPAPAVTYVGKLALPATITMAVIPLAPGQDAGAAPQILAEKGERKTTWVLPWAGGKLRFATSLDGCELLDPQ